MASALSPGMRGGPQTPRWCAGAEFTGASVVLEGAVLTNPYSNRRMDDAIESALSMSEEEQRERMGRMTDAVERYTVKDWADEQLAGFPQPVAP